MTDTDKTEVKEKSEFLKSWMIRPCWVYKEEYDECTCWKARFHQYFIHGNTIDCSTWKDDYESCLLWEKEESEAAYEALIDNETIRRKRRLAPHFGNTVWRKRDKPPDNWDAPLPEWMQEKLKKSVFNQVREEDLKKENGGYCTIM